MGQPSGCGEAAVQPGAALEPGSYAVSRLGVHVHLLRFSQHTCGLVAWRMQQ